MITAEVGETKAQGAGVHRYYRDVEVGGAQGRAGIEFHPAKEKDERAGDHESKIVGGKDSDFAICSVLTQSGAKDYGQGHGGKTSDGVDYDGD